MKSKDFNELLPIQTERLILRPCSIEDVDLFLKMDKQELTQAYLGGIKNRTREERLALLKEKEEKFKKKQGSFLTICLKEGTAIGFIGFKILEESSAELSYLFDCDYWRRGYCTEACQELIRIAFDILHLNAVYADAVVENIPSHKVLKKLGFRVYNRRPKESNVVFLDYVLGKRKMIDIIIPIYNTPKEDLERCLNSVLNQTAKDYLVYLIDDGSKQETKDYLDNFVKDKKNFVVKHIENGGVGNARNIGINISSSEYLAFVDADDTVEKGFIKEAYDLIQANNLDMIIGGYHEIKNNQITRTRVCEPGLHIYEGKQIDNFFSKLLSGKVNEKNKEIGDCPTGRIYTRLFKRSSLQDLRFNTNIHMSEDTLFMIDYINQVQRIGIIDKVWYNYYVNDYSISNGTKKDRLIHNVEGFVEEIIKRYEEESIQEKKEAYKARILKANNYIQELKNSNQQD